eukprot:6212785-Pleurochrysis_carterae.AAC.1
MAAAHQRQRRSGSGAVMAAAHKRQRRSGSGGASMAAAQWQRRDVHAYTCKNCLSLFKLPTFMNTFDKRQIACLRYRGRVSMLTVSADVNQL